MELRKGIVKERVTLTSNPIRNVKLRRIATRVTKSLIRFDKFGSIQNIKKRDKTLITHKVYIYIYIYYQFLDTLYRETLASIDPRFSTK